MSTPAQIGRYRIESELGRGGMAVVYLAYDPRFNRKVAVKILPPGMLRDARARARFEREIKTAAGLEHPAITPVYDAGEENGSPYLVMRLMSGGSLAARLSQGRIPLEETAQIISKIAQGLAYAHQRGVVHRDLKPQNILFDENGNPFIADFGVARVLEWTGSLAATMAGTPAYMSPEQAQGGEVDRRSDIYSLGVILYEMLSGSLPYRDALMKAFTKPLPDISNLNPALPPQVDRVVRRATAREKSARYADALELAKELQAAAFGAADKFVDVAPIVEKTASSSRFGAGALLALLIVGVLAVGAFLLRNQLFVSRQPAATALPVSAASAQPPLESPTPLPTATVFAPTAEPSPLPLAPACDSELSIPTPSVRETNKICVEKKPYTAVSIPQGASFESLSPAMSCIEETTSNGRAIISCTGQQLYSYQLKVCSPLPVLESASDKCGADLVYDPGGQCCRSAPAAGDGCVVFKVDLRACR
ncbi:MAG: protein kinase [Chloroflexi bacterium]|nr:protein kinase [Chloroflexota bacterium]